MTTSEHRRDYCGGTFMFSLDTGTGAKLARVVVSAISADVAGEI